MSGNVTLSEAPTTGLGRLITENRFFVPTHQRDYKWDRDRVERFFDDLTEAKDRGDKFYFIGLMVFMRHDDGRLRVLDGQQRLATTLILFSALRAWFAQVMPQGKEHGRIQYDFIGRAEYGQSHDEPKLTLNLNNDDRFQKYVTNGSPLDAVRAELRKTGKNDSNHQLLDAIQYLHERVSAVSQKYTDPAQLAAYLSDFILFLRDSVIVVRLTVPNESNAFRVFETLNDRGMDLSAVDLLKNYLFGLAYDQSVDSLKQIEHRWSQLTATLQNLRQEDFLKVFWTSRHGLIQLDDIFESVKQSYKTGPQASDLSIDLLDAAEHYAALDDAEDPVWAPQSDKCRELVGNLRILGSKLVRPVMLSALKKFQPKELERLLSLLEVVIVRWQLIGEGRTGTIERQCARLAASIWNDEVTTATAASERIQELYISDKEFQGKFREQRDFSNQKAVFLLKRIEEHERNVQKGTSGKDLSPHKSLSLEHILPQKPSQEWNAELLADPTFLEDCGTRLGNLCLLNEPMNREAARASFAKKKEIYSKSELLTTLQLAGRDHWDRQAVDHRQAWLASKAVTVWRFQ